MTSNRTIHAIILTLNEEQHIARCIESLRGQCTGIAVIDSGSRDATVSIAQAHGAQVIVNPWINYATQLNFAIEQFAVRGGWLLRIDADEIVDPDSRETLLEAIAKAREDVDGLIVQRRIHFLGRRIRHGAIEPSWQLRLWRNGRGRCEQRWMDEHIQVAGRVDKSGVILSDINLNSLTWWTAKHNGYASREAVEILNLRHGFLDLGATTKGQANQQARRRRFVKEKIYARLSPGLRALVYFLYRYFLRLGFLDGREGLYFHLMQALWYRTLVDAKVVEIEQFAHSSSPSIPEAIKDRVGIDIGKSQS
jgi:glycosyltransferase involved in cell wall biosynthesis